MTINKAITKPNINFIIGLPDNKIVNIDGVDDNGEFKYLWSGNSEIHSIFDKNNFNKEYSAILWHADPARNIKIPNVIVNCISDADISSKSLKRAITLINQIKKQLPEIYIYNNPERIFKTTRDAIYQQFNHLQNLIIPKVIRFSASSAQEVFEIVQKNKINFPFLMRPCGSHQSEGLQLIQSKNEIDKLHKYAFDGREYYITEFIDNKHQDGFYKKARLVIIAGELFIRHYISNPHWMVEGRSHFNYMKENYDTKIIEKYFLENFKEILGKKVIDDLFKIYDEIALDFLGFDVDIMPNGKLLVFEINVAQNIFLDVDISHFSYMKEYADKMKSALIKSVTDKMKF